MNNIKDEYNIYYEENNTLIASLLHDEFNDTNIELSESHFTQESVDKIVNNNIENKLIDTLINASTFENLIDEIAGIDIDFFNNDNNLSLLYEYINELLNANISVDVIAKKRSNNDLIHNQLNHSEFQDRNITDNDFFQNSFDLDFSPNNSLNTSNFDQFAFDNPFSVSDAFAYDDQFAYNEVLLAIDEIGAATRFHSDRYEGNPPNNPFDYSDSFAFDNPFSANDTFALSNPSIPSIPSIPSLPSLPSLPSISIPSIPSISIPSIGSFNAPSSSIGPSNDPINGLSLGVGLAIGDNLNNPLVPGLAIATSNSNQLGNSSFNFGSTSVTPDFLGGWDIRQPGGGTTSITPDFLGGWDIR